MTWRLAGVMAVAACGSPVAKAVDAAVAVDATTAIDGVVGSDAPGGHLTAPDRIDFGAAIIGCVSPIPTVTITNSGSLASGALTTSLGGSDPGHFHITTDGCAGQDLAPAASCTVAVQFAPTTAGAKAAALVVTGSAATVSVGLTGTGLAPNALSITSLVDFGVVAPGTTSAPKTLTVMQADGCPGTGTLSVSRTGIDPAQFAIATDTCSGIALAGGASCTIGVTYTAKASGTSSAQLSVMASPGGVASASLLGE